MSIFYSLRIIPKSNTKITLEQIISSIENGINSRLFLEEYSILKIQDKNKSFSISLFDFKNYLIDATPYNSTLEIITEKNEIDSSNDYLFLIYLNKSEFKELSLFSDNEDVEKFPIFIAFKSESTSIKEYDLINEDTEEYEEVTSENINSLIYSNGRGGISLWEFKLKPEKFKRFSNWLDKFYKNYRAITFYE